MFRIQYICILSFIVINLCKAQRKVVDGRKPTEHTNSRYVVYLIKANESVLYDAWMCGGALVTPSYIVTSAACMQDVQYVYAIAGYKKYVTYANLNTDSCTSKTKKKVVYQCFPNEYKFDYPKMEQWANIDIALVKVESPFDFRDDTFQEHCSYKPSSIEINYDLKLQEPGTDAIVFGWGHTKKWRSTDDTQDHNQKYLRWGAVKLATKDECKKHFEESQIKRIIDKYMICSIHEGGLDADGGKLTSNEKKYKKRCSPGSLRMGDECIADYDYSRRNDGNVTLGETRRRGICQNDHGGPLITWRGPKPILIGIASAFKVEGGSKKCTAPFLYTSTHCNGYFLHCLMNDSTDDSDLKQRCEELAKKGGVSWDRRSILWASHPDGPAENEGKELRKTNNEPDHENTRFRSPFQVKFLDV